MKIIDCEQGSDQWHAARLGIPTASQFHRIITPGGKPSKSAGPYAHDLLAEECLGVPLDAGASAFMQRGTALEEAARSHYAYQRSVSARQVGFVMLDDGSAGCSPDSFVGEEGGLEIKCAGAGKHVGHLLGVAVEYNVQIQGCMWICKRRWWDLVCYHPQLPSAIVRVARDDKFIDDLAFAVVAFTAMMAAKREELVPMGCVPNMARCPRHNIRRDVCRCPECTARQAQVA